MVRTVLFAAAGTTLPGSAVARIATSTAPTIAAALSASALFLSRSQLRAHSGLSMSKRDESTNRNRAVRGEDEHAGWRGGRRVVNKSTTSYRQ